MKKKFLAIVCMIACIFGLTACGGEEALTEYEQSKLEYAKQMATSTIVPMFAEFMDDEAASSFDGMTREEIAYLFATNYNMNAEGAAVVSAISSFHSAKDTMGEIQEIGEAEARIDGNQIIVEIPVTGSAKNAVAEVIVSNDRFFTLQSAALNPSATVGEMMGKAALNTVIGMGTVFAVLILISLIIACFGFIPKLQAKAAAKKKAAEPDKKEEAPVAAVQAAVPEQTAESDDLELAAVIAAAVAAYEGSASTDGFVVRSIRRRQAS